MITFGLTKPWHLGPLASQLDPVDVTEITAATGNDPKTALEDAVQISDEAVTVFDDEAIIGVFGIAYHDGTGFPWGFFTSTLRKIPALILRHSLETVEEWNEIYPHMVVYVLAENKRSRKYLEWLGFEPTGQLLDGRDATIFMEYERCVIRR